MKKADAQILKGVRFFVCNFIRADSHSAKKKGSAPEFFPVTLPETL